MKPIRRILAVTNRNNQFRRAVEAYRIAQDINAYRSSNPTHTEWVMLGDLNQNIFSTNAATIGQIDTSAQAVAITQSEFTTFRADTNLIPASFNPGADITFPLPYRTFPDDRYAAAGLQRLNLRQQNGTWTGTRSGRYVTLDYILVSAALTNGAVGEIYNSALEPAGLLKAGAPLATNASANASDHFAVFADIQMQDATNDLAVSPSSEVRFSGSAGGPFIPQTASYTVTNPGTQAVNFTISSDASWLVPQASSGTVSANGSTGFSVSIDAAAAPMTPGEYLGRITVSGASAVRTVRLVVLSPASDYLTQQFTTDTPFDLAYRSLTFTPDGSPDFYRATIGPASAFPVDPVGGTVVDLGLNGSREIALTGSRTIPLFGVNYAQFFIGSSGYITFAGPDYEYTPSLDFHFSQPRIAALFFDLDPTGGNVSYKQLTDRVVVTYRNVPQFDAGGANNFQIEMFFDGRIRLTWLGVGASSPGSGADPPLVGLSPGGGLPAQFKGSVFRDSPATPAESAFEAFVRGYGLDPSGSGAGAPGEDPDGDGVVNWAEFAFGGSPVRGDAGLLRLERAGNEVFFSFMGRTEGMAYAVEHSADLRALFAPASGITLTTPSDQSGVPQGWVRRRFVVPPGTSGFYRIRATEPVPN